jgi:hypothetical protein
MIQHGIPQHPFFFIVQPDIGKSYGERVQVDSEFEKPIIELEDPANKTRYKAQVWDVFKLHIDHVPRHFFLITYGAEAEKAIPRLEKKYPSIKQTRKVEFLLLKRL